MIASRLLLLQLSAFPGIRLIRNVDEACPELWLNYQEFHHENFVFCLQLFIANFPHKVGVEELPLVAGAICCANYFPASQWTGNSLCGKGVKIWYFIISKTSQPRQRTRCALVYCSDEDEAICGMIRFRVGENPYRNFITECKWGSGVAKVPIINRFHTKSTTIQRKWYRKHLPILPPIRTSASRQCRSKPWKITSRNHQ